MHWSLELPSLNARFGFRAHVPVVHIDDIASNVLGARVSPVCSQILITNACYIARKCACSSYCPAHAVLRGQALVHRGLQNHDKSPPRELQMRRCMERLGKQNRFIERRLQKPKFLLGAHATHATPPRAIVRTLGSRFHSTSPRGLPSGAPGAQLPGYM